MVQQLTLTAKEFAVSGTTIRWHWRLTEEGGSHLDDFGVCLETASREYAALTDLYGWLEQHPEEDPRQFLSGLGDWVTASVLGNSMAGKLAQSGPCAVRLWQDTTLMGQDIAAPDVTSLPLELATADGRPLAAQRVSFVISAGAQPPDRGGQRSSVARPLPRSPLRILGLFSLPDGERSMNLRRERHQLEDLTDLLQGSGREVSLSALQYGTTRDSLRDALEAGNGWDIVHLSGHGRAGLFVLEKPDGSADRVSGDLLVSLLAPLRNRVRLVAVSACESAGRLLAAAPGGAPPLAVASDSTSAGALAAKLARSLNCAVLGMRYPVSEQFAATFTREVYRLMLDKGQPLAQARAWALAEEAQRPATPERPALSLVTPALFGAPGLTLTLRAPERAEPPSFGYWATKKASVPGRPPRFVGRVGPMTQLGKALDTDSRGATVVIEGMEKIGKTALALEAVHWQASGFQVVAWHEFKRDAGSAARGLAETLRAKINGLDVSQVDGTDAEARDFAGRLSAYFARVRVLLVLDNADAELTDAGYWRDDRLALLVNAMTGHDGWGRVIVTTRCPIAGAGLGAAPAVRLAPLSEAEAVLLADEFPGLRALLDGDAPPLDAESARNLASGVLAAIRGHPALLEIAVGQCADPLVLSRMTIIARGIWEASESDPEAAYLAILRVWQS